MKGTALRLLLYGAPVTLFLWPTIRTTPALGFGLSVSVIILANLIVWKVENMALRQREGDSN